MPSSSRASFVLERPPAPLPPLPEIPAPPELQSETPSVRRLLDHIHSFSCDNGGSFPSPVWCCALEAGGGERDDSPLWSERFWEDSGIESVAKKPCNPALWQIDEAKWLDGTSESRLLTSQRKLLAELAGSPYSERPPRSLKENPGYFLKHGRGLSLNLSPLSMPSRARAQESWGSPDSAARPKLIRLEDGASHTFRDWTGFPTYREFFAFCAQERHAIFKAAREHFTPALIYCGGLTALDDYRRAWADTDTAFSTASFLYGERRIRLHFAWLSNRPQRSSSASDKPARPEDAPRAETLLVIGPFFVNPLEIIPSNLPRRWGGIINVRSPLLPRAGPAPSGVMHASGGKGAIGNKWLELRTWREELHESSADSAKPYKFHKHSLLPPAPKRPKQQDASPNSPVHFLLAPMLATHRQVQLEPQPAEPIGRNSSPLPNLSGYVMPYCYISAPTSIQIILPFPKKFKSDVK